MDGTSAQCEVVVREVRREIEAALQEHQQNVTEQFNEWSTRQDAALDRLEEFCALVSQAIGKTMIAQTVPTSIVKPGMSFADAKAKSFIDIGALGSSGLKTPEKALRAPAGVPAGGQTPKKGRPSQNECTSGGEEASIGTAAGESNRIAQLGKYRQSELKSRRKSVNPRKSVDPRSSAGTFASSRASVASVSAASTRASVKEKITRIENRFNTDFMTRGSLFAPTMDDEGSEGTEEGEEEAAPAWCWVQRASRTVIDSPIFDAICGAVILANTVLIGVEAEFATIYDRPDQAVLLAQTVMSLWFAVELFIRIVAIGVRDFFCGTEWRWNWFDAGLVMMAVIDYAAEAFAVAGYSSMARIVRTLRVIRILRSLRIIRVLRYVREFRKMIFAIQGSVQTLLWSLLLLFFSLYAFAICFTTGVADHLKTSKSLTEKETQVLEDLYGTLMRSFYSLYLAMSQGRAWGDFLAPLMDVGNFFVGVFLLFITVTTFGVLNIVTSVFVESAMRTAQHYRELLVQDKMRDWENLVRHMREVFAQIDEDGSGTISLPEMEYFLADPDLRMYVEALDISTADTRSLFRLLDKDNSGRIDIDEFCTGCMRLKGPAKSFDIHCVQFEIQHVCSKWAEFMMFAETRLLTMEAMLQNMGMDPRLASVAGSPMLGSIASAETYSSEEPAIFEEKDFTKVTC